jgi:tetratricopeptide (TPR) repeat protein
MRTSSPQTRERSVNTVRNGCGATLVLLFLSWLLLAPARSVAQNPAQPVPELRIIVVDSQSEAEQVLKRLQAGSDFATLAREKSIDPSAANGGSLGRIDPATLRTELRDALKGVETGQLTGPVKIANGYAILKVDGRTAPADNGQPVSPPANPAQGNAPVVSTGQGMTPTALLALAGRGKVAYPPDVSGAVEVEVAFKTLPKPADWDHDLHSVCEVRKQTLARAINHLRQLLDPNDPDSYAVTKPDQMGRVHFSLAQLLASQGKMEPAIQEWLKAYKLAVTDSPQMVPELEEVLGTAYLHKSEMENEVYRKPGDRCIFPPRKSVGYQNTADLERAVQHFTRFLDKKPDTLEVKWLLNLAYMYAGKYPGGVPKKYLIPPSVFESKENIGRFRDVAPDAGLNSFSAAGGAIVDDFENNGLLDVVTSTYDHCEPLHFFHNNGDGTFTERATQAGLADQLGGLNLIQTDYNNDGCIDIFVLRGAWQMPIRSSLLRNNCDGTFTDVTKEAGLAEPIASQAAVWTDIDNDGFLDLFIGNEQGSTRLYHNKGDGTFENIAESAGVDRVSFSKGVAAADYDNDGFMDLYVSNMGSNNFLYHNNHDRTFTEVGKQAGVQAPWMSFATWFFDYDNDGLPDLFVTSYYMSPEEILRRQLDQPYNVETLKLYHNEGNGTFRDVTTEVGLDHVYNPMGANFGDIDNDGFLDFYLGTGTPPYGDILPNVLFHNQGGKKFVDVTASSGTGELHKGHGVAFADLDDDGDEDIVAEIGGAVPGDRHAIRLFENPGNGNDWITVRLVGVKSNRAALGARIKVIVENENHERRSIYRTVGSGGSFGASPLQQHIGLGQNAKIVSLEVWWPASDTRQVFSDVGKNQFIEIKEFGKDYAHLDRPRTRLGGKLHTPAAKLTTPASSGGRRTAPSRPTN